MSAKFPRGEQTHSQPSVYDKYIVTPIHTRMQIFMNAETPLETDYLLASHERLLQGGLLSSRTTKLQNMSVLKFNTFSHNFIQVWYNRFACLNFDL